MPASGQRPLRRAVFLDRDGTINRNVGYLADPAGIELLPRAAQAIAILNRLGLLTIMITNQSAIARGLATEAQVQRVCSEVALQVARESGARFDGVYYCPYHEDHPGWQEFHTWRKPRPGMLLQAAQDFHIDLTRSFLIGDGLIDHQAGKAAHSGITTFLLPSKYHTGESDADHHVESLWHAVEIIAAQLGAEGLRSHVRA